LKGLKEVKKFGVICESFTEAEIAENLIKKITNKINDIEVSNTTIDSNSMVVGHRILNLALSQFGALVNKLGNIRGPLDLYKVLNSVVPAMNSALNGFLFSAGIDVWELVSLCTIVTEFVEKLSLARSKVQLFEHLISDIRNTIKKAWFNFGRMGIFPLFKISSSFDFKIVESDKKSIDLNSHVFSVARCSLQRTSWNVVREVEDETVGVVSGFKSNNVGMKIWKMEDRKKKIIEVEKEIIKSKQFSPSNFAESSQEKKVSVESKNILKRMDAKSYLTEVKNTDVGFVPSSDLEEENAAKVNLNSVSFVKVSEDIVNLLRGGKVEELIASAWECLILLIILVSCLFQKEGNMKYKTLFQKIKN
jgi:hypothetical protein